MLPASGTSGTEFVCTGSVEKAILTRICSTTLLLIGYGDVAIGRKIKKQKNKTTEMLSEELVLIQGP